MLIPENGRPKEYTPQDKEDIITQLGPYLDEHICHANLLYINVEQFDSIDVDATPVMDTIAAYIRRFCFGSLLHDTLLDCWAFNFRLEQKIKDIINARQPSKCLFELSMSDYPSKVCSNLYGIANTILGANDGNSYTCKGSDAILKLAQELPEECQYHFEVASHSYRLRGIYDEFIEGLATEIECNVKYQITSTFYRAVDDNNFDWVLNGLKKLQAVKFDYKD